MVRWAARALIPIALSLSSALPAAERGHRLVEGSADKSGLFTTAGEAGAVYQLKGGARLSVSGGSRFWFQRALELKLGAPGEPSTQTQVVQLDAGRADVEVPKGARTAVLVRGPKKLSSVTKQGRGVFIAQSGAATTASLEGDMLVGIGNSWSPLPSRHAVSRGVPDSSAEPRPLLNAPHARVPTSLLLADDVTQATIEWPAVAGAVSYSVVVVSDPGSFERTVVVREPRAVIQELGPGRYRATIRAIDGEGLESVASEPARFRVVGYDLPRDAKRRASGTIVLDRRQRLPLVEADGLELTYNRSNQFVPAPQAVGLSRNEPTLVRLREPGSSSEVTIRLEPDGLRARVSLSPAVARWPEDPVQVNVHLFDLYDHPVHDSSEVSLRVTVNLKPVTVKWRRNGAHLSTTVPPQRGDGPWVVRVEATDTSGSTLGRGFLEVARGAEPRKTTTTSNASRRAAPRL